MNNKMKYFSMFSGIGGFEIGIQNAYEKKVQNVRPIQQENSRLESELNQPLPQYNKSFSAECVGFSEIDKYAIQVYRYHFSNHRNYGNCTKIITSELSDFDLLIAGFPCQAFSIAGKRGGFKDTRGTLFFEIARIARDKRPSCLLLENVKGLLNHNEGNTFATIITTLDELGYDCEWCVLNSKNFGVPQNRERVFIIGYFRGTSRKQVFPIRENNEILDVNIGNKKPKQEIRFNKFCGKAITSDGIADTLTKSYGNMSGDSTKLIEITKEKSQGYRVYDSQGIATTLAGEAGGVGAKTGLYMINLHQKRTGEYGDGIKEMHEPSFTLDSSSGYDLTIASESKIRRLTPIECERLQAFPDDWTRYGKNENGDIIEMSDTQRYKMCGNALTTNVVEAIMKKLL